MIRKDRPTPRRGLAAPSAVPRGRIAAAALATSLGALLSLGPRAVEADGFVPLFNGQDLEGWYTWDERHGKDNDVEGYYRVRGGELVVLDIPESDEDKAFGYVSTTSDHADYHLRFEYRWEGRKFAPRKDRLRDSGVLYHLVGDDRIWPTSLESQVQEGDTGDFFGLGGTRITTTANARTYSPTAEARDPGCCVTASRVADTLDGWNLSEVVVRGDSAVHIVNGQVVNRLWDARAGGRPLSAGRIAFQAEGATIRYRNIEIRPLATGAPRVLLFSETRGFRHGSIPNALDALEELAASAGIETDRAGDSSGVFTDANLAGYDAVAWVMTTGDVLDADEQAAFEHYVRSGGGYVGLHAASDTEYGWPWYGDLVGARFDRHPAVQSARLVVEDGGHPSTAHLGSTWTRTDEWYDFRTNPRSRVNVLLGLDERSYDGGRMGDDHPIAWYHEHDGGRSWYTGGGHTAASYAEPDFRAHLLGGLRYAAGLAGPAGGAPPTVPGPVPAPGPAPTPAPTPAPSQSAPQAPADALDRAGWRVSASRSSAGQGPANAIDGDVGTRWSTGGLQTPGTRFDIDLGARRGIDGIVLDAGPEATDHPRGYEVRVSDDGRDFARVVARGVGSGRATVIAFPPVAARHVRLVQTGSDGARWWSVHELHVSGAAVPAPAPPAGSNDIALSFVDATRDVDLGALVEGRPVDVADVATFSVRALPPAGTRSVTFALSGAGTHAQTENVAAWALFGNAGSDFDGRPALPGEYTLRVRAHSARSGTGRVLADRRTSFTLRATGAGPTSAPSPPGPVGPVSTALARDGWTATASSVGDGETTGAAFDDDPASRWSTGTRQAPGQFFQIDLGATRRFDRIVLATADEQPFDFPRGYTVRVSGDGRSFGAPIASGVGRATTDIRLPATTARYVRIEQTGGDVFRWWSIYDATLFADR